MTTGPSISDRNGNCSHSNDPPGIHHNGGDLLLTDDGLLLITLGDGDAFTRDSNGGEVLADDPNRFADDPTTLRGSILRLHPTPGGAEPYEIPTDNPFANGPLATDDGRTVNGAPEVFAWGLRNPWKINIDPATDALWVADVGSEALEEINVVMPVDGHAAGWAVDFGWSGFEGSQTRNDDVEPVFAEPIEPVFEYGRGDGRCAISGGAVYRGDAIPELWSGLRVRRLLRWLDMGLRFNDWRRIDTRLGISGDQQRAHRP